MRSFPVVAVVMAAALLLAGCTSVTNGTPVPGSTPPTPPTSPTSPAPTSSTPTTPGPTVSSDAPEDSIQFPATGGAAAKATAPTNPCAMISRSNWQTILTATQNQNARTEAGIFAGDIIDKNRISAQCTINDGTGQIPLRWGYYLPGWSFAQEKKSQQGNVIGTLPQPGSAPLTVYRGDTQSMLFTEVRGVTVYLSNSHVQELRYQGKTLTTMFSELVAHVPQDLFSYGLGAPAGCPAATDARLTALIGQPTYSTGYSAYGNAECDYFSATTKRWANLGAQNQTKQFYEQDQAATRSMGNTAKPWFPDVPGATAEMFNLGQQITVYFVVPAKYAYLIVQSGRLDTVGVPHQQYGALATWWRDTWLPKLPATRRTS